MLMVRLSLFIYSQTSTLISFIAKIGLELGCSIGKRIKRCI